MTAKPIPKPPTGLGTRGRALWRDVQAERELDAAGRMLLHEACRIADRLEQLDRILRAEVSTWAVIKDEFVGHRKVTNVVLDDALGEARQQALGLRQILTTLKLVTAVERSRGEASALDQLAARRTARLAETPDRVGT